MTPAERIAKMKAAKAASPSAKSPAPVRRPKIDLNKMKKQAAESSAVEIRRIIDMPIKEELSREDYEVISEHYLQAHVFNSPDDPFRRLFDTQAESLVAYNRCQGGFFPLAVGGGKTLTSLLTANDAFMGGIKKIMLLVPPGLADQLVETDIKVCRKKTIFNIPVWNMAGIPHGKRKLLAHSGRQGIYIYTYSLLSSAKDSENDILDAIAPELIILDEAHSVTRPSSRTRRLWRYVEKARPQLVPLSGTMTQKSLNDFYSLAHHALGDFNFLPNSKVMTEEWSKIIDTSASNMSDYREDDVPKAGAIKDIITWARSNFPHEKDEHDRHMFSDSLTGYRQAFRKRMETCPGVVISSGHELPYSLYIDNDPVERPDLCKGYDLQQDLISKLKNEWVTPNGDELEEKMHLFRWLYWIEGAGFYNELYWPTEDWLVEHNKACSTSEAKDLLERSQMHLMQQRGYHSSLRKWLQTRARPHLDSPMLVGNSMYHKGPKEVGEELYTMWKNMKDHDFDERIDRHKRAVRVCDFKITKAVQWAQNLPKGEGGLIWYDNEEIGLWAKERLEAAGVDFLFAPGGKAANALLRQPELCRGKVILLTINAHFQGKNLQFDRNQFYIQWPRSAKYAEQAIGRQHREQQEYDEVYVTTCLTSKFDSVLYSATLNDAVYVHVSMGNRQKIVYGKYLYKPQLMSYEVMEAMGVDFPRKLEGAAAKYAQERFGESV